MPLGTSRLSTQSGQLDLDKRERRIMASRGVKDLVSRRRRATRDSDEDESEAGAEDSQSEGSVLSDRNDFDVDGSEMSDIEASDGKESEHPALHPKGLDEQRKAQSETPRNREGPHTTTGKTIRPGEQGPSFQPTADTKLMMNGLKISNETAQSETVDFDGHDETEAAKTASAKKDVSGDDRRQETDEQRKRREHDPTFIPNRGNFFMHDARVSEQRGFSGHGRGRGRGRGAIGGPFSPAVYVYDDQPTLNRSITLGSIASFDSLMPTLRWSFLLIAT